MPEKTGLEELEEQSKPIFGGPKSLSALDKSMLEMSDTNRWVYDSRQSELLASWHMLYEALVACDNRQPHYETIHNEANDTWQKKLIRIDNWKWMLDLEYLVKTNQLTIQAFSRMQHLRQSAAMTSIAQVEEERKGLFARMFGG